MSLEALYQQLANDGFPVCPKCGVLHPDEEHEQEHTVRKPRRRRPRGAGEDLRALPPVHRAEPLFVEAIERFQGTLKMLPFIKQWFSDGRFVTEAVYPESSGEYAHLYSRQDFEDAGEDAEAWAQACEEHGYDPGVQEFRVPVRRERPGGAGTPMS